MVVLRPHCYLAVYVCVAATSLLSIRAESTASVHDVNAGATLFHTECAICHGRRGTGGRGPDLTRGAWRSALDDPALFQVIATGIAGSAMPGAMGNHSAVEVWQLVAYVRALGRPDLPARVEGDAPAGRRLFEEHDRCSTCHLVNGRGGRTGPDLSGIGRTRPIASLRAALSKPSESVDPTWRSLRVTETTGSIFVGRRMDEDTFSVRLLDHAGTLRNFERAKVQVIERITTTICPRGLSGLTAPEFADLVAYLSTLTGR